MEVVRNFVTHNPKPADGKNICPQKLPASTQCSRPNKVATTRQTRIHEVNLTLDMLFTFTA